MAVRSYIVPVVCTVALAAAGGVIVAYTPRRKLVVQVKSQQHLKLHAKIAAIVRHFIDIDYCVELVSADDATADFPDTQLLALSSCQSLVYKGQSLTALPQKTMSLATLQKLDLSRNMLTYLPDMSQLQSLVDLDVSHNQLVSIPDSINDLTSLQYLNLMANSLVQLPELSRLGKLSRLGLKGNSLTALPDMSGLISLKELFITNNQLVSLPDLSCCTSLVKVQASFNKIRELPDVSNLQKLELLRVACNDISKVSASLGNFGALAWVSLAGNPLCPHPEAARTAMPTLAADAFSWGKALGDGASGDVFAATMYGHEVAIKVFKGEVSPDGRAADEIEVTCFVEHPHLTKVLAVIEEPHALVLQRVAGQPLAQKPNLQSLLRCRWAPGRSFRTHLVAQVAQDVSSALAYLHENHICHGDVYAHNIMVDEDTSHATLLDYGASFFYPPNTLPYEAHEVRAFGLFLSDMLARVDDAAAHEDAFAQLYATAVHSLQPFPRDRPTFAEIAARCKLAKASKGVSAGAASSDGALKGSGIPVLANAV